MFNIGDLVIYSAQGICRIDDICEKNFQGNNKSYYVLHPVNNSKLEISIPVDNNKITMQELIKRGEAEEILESFRYPGIDWIEINTMRNQVYSGIVKTGNRREISRVLNTLMREKNKVELNGKKFYEQDNKLLTSIQNILFSDLAMSFGTTAEIISEKINGIISEQLY